MLTYARQTSSPRAPAPNEYKGHTIFDEIRSSDLDTFLRIIELIKKHYIKDTNNLDRVKTTIQIVKELEAGI